MLLGALLLAAATLLAGCNYFCDGSWERCTDLSSLTSPSSIPAWQGMTCMPTCDDLLVRATCEEPCLVPAVPPRAQILRSSTTSGTTVIDTRWQPRCF
jgi:hypothetical protein